MYTRGGCIVDVWENQYNIVKLKKKKKRHLLLGRKAMKKKIIIKTFVLVMFNTEYIKTQF